MGRPRLLDLFCGAGGAAMGYSRAGFEVVGVDIAPQPRYPFEFVQDDALDWLDDFINDGCPPEFDAIHGSPPCQAFTTLRAMLKKDEPDLITPLRPYLERTGLPYVLENVEGARSMMRDPVTICGSSLGMRVRRHRLFETNWTLLVSPCAHGQQGQPIGVYGTGGGGQMTRGYKATRAEAPAAMDVHWMTHEELAQAIPPAYTELIGHQLIQHLAYAGSV